MKLFRVRNLVIIAVIGLLVALYYFKPTSSSQSTGLAKKQIPIVTVGITVATPKQIDSKIQISGTLLAYREAELHAESSGNVTNFSLPEGQLVKQGTLLVKINDADLKAQLVKNAEQIRHAEDVETRQKALLERGGLSKEDYEASLNTLNILKSEKQLLLTQIAKTEVRAPFDGIIGLKYITLGSYITPASKIVSIIQPDPMKLECSVPEKYSAFLKKGSTLTFLSRGSTKRFKATIYAVDPKIDLATRTIAFRASVENSNGELTSGSFIEVELPIGQTHEGLMVPSESVIPDIKGQKVFVYKSGKAEARPIVMGIRTEKEIEILKGIEAGDTVITKGTTQVKANAPVVLSP
ncbi:MAG: efflux RND transporter periplasmic adaptor subunit [Ignavibacteriae bacterium]|nr:efflux RND transporter periplasmic adaptor subunit [Ignavibacteriota bacterium]